MIDSDVIASLPKVELHDHLDGGLRPATIVELAAEIGYELPTPDPAELEKWFYDAANSGDLPTYLTTFDHTTAGSGVGIGAAAGVILGGAIRSIFK